MSSKKKSVSSVIFSRNKLGSNDVLIIILAGFLLAGFLTVTKFNMPGSGRQEAVLLISLEGGGYDRMFQGEVVEGMSVFQALVASAKAGEIEFSYIVDSNNKIVIKELNGYTKIKDRKLVFYLNGSKIDASSINRIFIKGGDRIEIRPE